MSRPTQSRGCVANEAWKQEIGDCNMIANIRGGMSMISNMSTIVGFLCLVVGKMLNLVAPLDCLE